MIIELLGALGPRWSKIVKALPGRSISSIRNRWQRIDKGKRMQEEGKVSKNRCQVCGEPKRGHVCFARLRAAAAAKQAGIVGVRQVLHVHPKGTCLRDAVLDAMPRAGRATRRR